MSNDLDKILRINEGFDTIIYNSAHNKELETRLNRYNFLIKHANAEVKYPLNYLPTVLEEHRAIFEAFKSKNPDAGAEATEIHMYKSMLRRKSVSYTHLDVYKRQYCLTLASSVHFLIFTGDSSKS